MQHTVKNLSQVFSTRLRRKLNSKKFQVLFGVFSFALTALLCCSNYGLPEPNSLGLANWGKSTTTVPSSGNVSAFHGVAMDNDGNIVAVGGQYNGEFAYGNGVTASGAYSGDNALLVKCNANGKTLWAKSTTAATGSSSFYSVAIDSEDNIYAVGVQGADNTFDYGNGVTTKGAYGSGNNAMVVKYNSSGQALWARSTTSAAANSQFSGVAIDNEGNIYVVGYQHGNTTFDYGNGVTVSGTRSSGDNAVMVKYNSNGKVLWAKNAIMGNGSRFYSIAIDNKDNIYVVGYQYGNTTFGWNNGVTAKGVTSQENSVVVKYNSSGKAQWAKTVVYASAPDINSNFLGVTTDRQGNVYAVGSQAPDNGIQTVDYGGLSLPLTGTKEEPSSVLVKYNSSGQTQWARVSKSSSASSDFYAVAVTFAGDVYAVGSQYADAFDYGNGVTATGKSTNSNSTLVKYNTDGKTLWAKVQTKTAKMSGFKDIVAGNNKLFVVGYQEGSDAFDYGNNVDITGVGTSLNVVLTTFDQ